MLNKFFLMFRDGCLILGIILLLIITLEFGSKFYFFCNSDLGPSQRNEEKRRAYTIKSYHMYKNYSWLNDFVNEECECTEFIWEPYFYWKSKNCSGEYVSTDSNGNRKTYNQIPLREAEIKIYMFGGSTLWGEAARDDYTIPSYVSKILFEKGYDNFYIVNYGVPAHVSTQELIRLLMELRDGNVPEICIFYDGVNDIISTSQNSRAGVTIGEITRNREFNRNTDKIIGNADWLKILSQKSSVINLYYQLSGSSGAMKSFWQQGRKKKVANRNLFKESLVDETVSAYLSNTKLIKTLLESHNAEPYFFWQPSLFSKKNYSSAEEKIIRKTKRGFKEFNNRVYKKISLIKPSEDFVDLQNVFGENKDDLFIDIFHKTEDANRIVAEAISAHLIKNSKFLRKN